MNNELDDIDLLNPRIACLLHLYTFEALSPSQQKELDEWINESEGNRLTFEMATDPEILIAGVEFLDSFKDDNGMDLVMSQLNLSKETPVFLQSRFSFLK